MEAGTGRGAYRGLHSITETPSAPPVSILRQRYTDNHYFVQFQTPDEAEKLFSTDIELFFKMMFQRPAPKEKWPTLIPRVYDLFGRFNAGKIPNASKLLVSDDIIDVYIKAYRNSGFHGGINLYRNVDRNWELMEGRDEIVIAPSLWIGAELDIFLPPESSVSMEEIVPNLEKQIIPNAGHWLTWESPQLLNNTILSWLNRTF